MQAVCAEPGVDVGDDAQRIGAAIGELGDALHEFDRLAEQALFVRPQAVRRPEHQRGLEQISPDVQIQDLSPFAPAKSRLQAIGSSAG